MPDTMVGAEGSDVLPLPSRVEEGVTSSVWEPDGLERKQLAEGGHVALAVFAAPTPPVSLLVAAPHCQRCSRQMVWNDALLTYVCSEEEDGEG